MVCDLAEVYHIFNYQEYSPILVGTLVFGLDRNSRVMMDISESKITLERMLLAKIADELAFLSWTKTKDATKSKSRPKSILRNLLGKEEEKEQYDTFETYEEFQQKWNSI